MQFDLGPGRQWLRFIGPTLTSVLWLGKIELSDEWVIVCGVCENFFFFYINGEDELP